MSKRFRHQQQTSNNLPNWISFWTFRYWKMWSKLILRFRSVLFWEMCPVFIGVGETNFDSKRYGPVWPDRVIYWTLGNFSKPVATIILPKSLTFLGNFCKDVKIFNFLVKLFLGNFYRLLATFYWSHWYGLKSICGHSRWKVIGSNPHTVKLFK